MAGKRQPTEAQLAALATVRTTANTLSVALPAKVKLEPEENLILLYLTGASVNFDLSAEYRVLRG